MFRNLESFYPGRVRALLVYDVSCIWWLSHCLCVVFGMCMYDPQHCRKKRLIVRIAAQCRVIEWLHIEGQAFHLALCVLFVTQLSFFVSSLVYDFSGSGSGSGSGEEEESTSIPVIPTDRDIIVRPTVRTAAASSLRSNVQTAFISLCTIVLSVYYLTAWCTCNWVPRCTIDDVTCMFGWCHFVLPCFMWMMMSSCCVSQTWWHHQCLCTKYAHP